MDTTSPRWIRIGGLLVAALVGAALATVLLVTPSPDDSSAEAGFARDMSMHHAQAVEMSLLIMDRSTDEDILVLAEDMALSQQAQIGQMGGWLDLWGLPRAGAESSMSWMGMGGMPMMGMATSDQLAALREAEDAEAERLFLELMIAHHIGGVDMAEAALERTDNAVVQALATAMATSQSSEIEYMERLLDQRE
ncbi:DUF305 domain-containing protein [Euzebya tangerina]|uniref:DUF305 domain-containing protein n=1 Tax=Euzebya tangerina TaxID=591198 RepID=UPI000E30FE37|nr:DUF305 domain-containing protein [Euzebya tangerina]